MSKLKTLRLEAGLSQKQLAEKAGCNLRMLQYYEQGIKNLDHARLDILLKYCLALDCNLVDLIEDPQYLALLNRYDFGEI